MGGVTALALLLVALLPHAAYAWTPGTHVFLGDAVLRSLSLLPAHIAHVHGILRGIREHRAGIHAHGSE